MRLRVVGPNASYGLIPPPGSGIIVIDRDDPSVLLPMPATFEVHRASVDPRRGHYYFMLADDVAEADVPRAFAGGEIRVGGSGHVVGPYCHHKDGSIYESNGAAVGIADRELVEALVGLPPVHTGVNGVAEPIEGTRHAFLVGQARKFAGWHFDAERIEDELRTLNATVCQPPLSEKAAEFRRMAAWAADNVKPDAPMRIRHGRTHHVGYWTPRSIT